MSSTLNVSKMIATTITFKWNFTIGCSSSSDSDVKKCLKSPIFPPDTEETTVQWQIKVEYRENVGADLWLFGMPKNIAFVKASFVFDMQMEDGLEITKKICGYEMYNFDTTAEPNWKKIIGWNTFCSHYTVNGKNRRYLDNKPVILFCTIHIVDDEKDAPGCVNLFFKVPACNLWQSLETLLTTGKNADVTLVAKDNQQKIKAHKAILKARSPVFDAMFSNQLSENLDNLVEIKDLDYEVLEKMVRFMYTGKVSNLSSGADRLMMAADKYDLPMLRMMCEKQMGINLSVENAAQTLVLADLHHGSQLKKYTLNFIKHHAQRVMATDDWQEIQYKYPNLLYDVCQSLATLQLEN